MTEREHHDPRPSVAAIKGHPIHPMLIPFPIALLALVPVTDIVYATTGGVFWAQASYYMLWAGLVAGGIAAIAGLIDFLGIREARQHRHGWFHLGANGSAIGLAVVNVLLRAGEGDFIAAIVPSGLILSIITLLLLGVGGWYGGELAYRHKIGVMPDDEDRELRERRRPAPPRPATPLRERPHHG
jgi:uncharacterized membrane protein